MRRFFAAILIAVFCSSSPAAENGRVEQRRELEEKARAGKAAAADFARLGTLRSIDGEHEQALLAYEVAARLEPQSPEYLGNVAITLYFLDRRAEAKVWFEKVLAAAPQDPRALGYLKTIAELEQKQAEQLARLQERLHPESDTFEEYLRLARIYYRLQKWEEAEKFFRGADQRNAKSYEVKGALARLAYRRRDFSGAASRWEEAAAIAPAAVEAHAEAGRLYAFLGRYPEAARAWRRVAELAGPGRPEAAEARYYLQHLSGY